MDGARDEIEHEIEQALLQAIHARPEDDAPRLVYADWLGERGDPLGELIVVQCAMALLDREHDDSRPALEARDRELRAQHEARWWRGLETIPGVTNAYFVRGFVPRVVLPEQELAANASKLFAAAPALVELYLRKAAANDVRVPAELARIRSIHFESTAYALACLASPHLALLERAMERHRRCGRTCAERCRTLRQVGGEAAVTHAARRPSSRDRGGAAEDCDRQNPAVQAEVSC